MKENQHYIPQFILRKFINGNTHGFRVFDVKKQQFLPGIKHPPKTMMKKLFYEHNKLQPNEIEDLLSKRETLYAPIIQKILSGEAIGKKEFGLLMEFRHVTYYRSNEFIAFHTHKKSRGKNSWSQRADWRMINGIYRIDDRESDLKLSQLSAIKRTIEGTEPVLQMSMLTPVCFVFKSSKRKFIIGDNGSLSFGGELDGMIVIILSPECAIMFPRTLKALEILQEYNLKIGDPLLVFESAPNDVVDLINEQTKKQAYEYWVEVS